MMQTPDRQVPRLLFGRCFPCIHLFTALQLTEGVVWTREPRRWQSPGFGGPPRLG